MILFLVGAISLQADGIDFYQGSWTEALEEAKKSDKLIFVDAYTTWCGPCKMMSKKVFPQANVGEVFNANFINLKLDMESSESKEFKRSFTVKAYPTLLFINGDGKLIHKIVGAKQPEDLINEANLAIRKNDKSGRYEEDYLSGKRDYELVYNYVKALNAVEKPSLKISNDYINSKPDITPDQLAEFLHIAVIDSDSKLFTQYLSYQKKIEQLHGKKAFLETSHNAYLKTVDKAIEYEYRELIDEAISSYKKIDKKAAETFALEANLKYYTAYANAEGYEKHLGKYYKKVAKKDEVKLSNLISQIESGFPKNTKLQDKAIDYCKQWVSINPSEKSYIRYLEMLQKNKKIEAGIKEGEKAKKWLEENEKATHYVERYIKYMKSLI